MILPADESNATVVLNNADCNPTGPSLQKVGQGPHRDSKTQKHTFLKKSTIVKEVSKGLVLRVQDLRGHVEFSRSEFTSCVPQSLFG